MSLSAWLDYLVSEHEWLTLIAIGIIALAIMIFVWCVLSSLWVMIVEISETARRSQDSAWLRGRRSERADREADPLPREAGYGGGIYERLPDGSERRLDK